jgi:diguanylate cyclase (GGDEF)-like protein
LAGTGLTVERTVSVSVDGTDKVFELEASDQLDNVSLQGLVVVLHDVTDRHLLEGELRHQAFHDVLTGLPNRKLFSERVRAATQASGETSVLFVDLDDFKDVNDGLGHHAGDLLLCAVAKRLSQACRAGDTVARLGGDEFAVLVVDHSADGTPQAVARRVLEVLELPFEVLGQRISVGASVGVATGSGLDEDELLRHADVAMYRAKAAGKGTLALFEPGMDDLATERLCLHVDLAEGIPRGDFELRYQPVFDLATGELRSGEALVRWKHPTLGLLTPDRFIGLAEDTGLIIPLGQWVLDEACRQAARWPDDIGIAVNLSARQLDHPTLLEDVAHTLATTGIRPARLVLEVTESVVVRDMDTTVRRLADLRALGVRVAIDDFGTGYSSLSSLLELPVDVLKIDGSFVSTMLERSEATSLVRLVVEMGHLLGLDVVAEGIEDAEQARALQQNQCQLGQGFLYSRPVDAATFAGFIAAPANAATDAVLEDATG